jgi:hypothetical protein
VLGHRLLVVGLGLLLGLSPPLLERLEMPLPLESLGGHEPLDLGSLGVGLAGLGGDLTGNDEGSDIVLFVEVEESADLGG